MALQPVPIADRRPTVLLAEDDPLIAELAAGALESAGFAVTAVEAAEDVLGLAVMDVPFDALVTDINLAGPLDGWELAEALRETRPDLPVVYASGGAGPDGHARGVADAAFLSKPYNPLVLCEMVSRFVSPRAPQPAAVVPPPPREEPRPALRLIA